MLSKDEMREAWDCVWPRSVTAMYGRTHLDIIFHGDKPRAFTIARNKTRLVDNWTNEMNELYGKEPSEGR